MNKYNFTIFTQITAITISYLLPWVILFELKPYITFGIFTLIFITFGGFFLLYPLFLRLVIKWFRFNELEDKE